ncbi:hypothetical protein SAVIM338S_07045 [Streptomyces avidinii]
MTNQQHGTPSSPSSEELRDQIENTRNELGRTVEALAAKADVKAQAQAKAADVKAQAKEAAVEAKTQAKATAADVTAQAKATATDVTAQAKAAAAGVTAQAKEVTAQARETAVSMKDQAAQLVKDKTPEPVLDEAGRIANTARANRTPLIAIGAAVAVVLLVRRGRRRK